MIDRIMGLDMTTGQFLAVPLVNVPNSRTESANHRSNVTVADVLSVPTLGTVTSQTITDGTLVVGTTYHWAVMAYNRWGVTTPTAIGTGTPSGSDNALRIPIDQVTGADGYMIHLSTDAAPKGVLQITETQRASGIACITTYTPIAGSITGCVDIGCVGTGQLTTANNFIVNTAYKPVSITPIVNDTNRGKCYLHVKTSVTDLRIAPTLQLIPFFINANSSGDWYSGISIPLSLPPFEQEIELDIDGATSFLILIASLTGQGATVNIDYELV